MWHVQGCVTCVVSVWDVFVYVLSWLCLVLCVSVWMCADLCSHPLLAASD